LKAFPVEEWEKLEEKLLNEGRTKQGLGDFVRYVISGVTECQLDKQGRILLPGSLRNEFKIEKDIILNGMLDHFEIWDKNDWMEETGRTRKNFHNFEPDLSSMGIL
jgi:MraZ protein